MDFIQVLLLIMIVVCLLFLLGIPDRIKPYVGKRKRELTAAAEDVGTMETRIDKALRSLNSEPTWTSEKASRIAQYVYQSGHFTVRIEPQSPVVSLSYLFFFKTSMENLSLIRSLCNQVNLNTELERIVYSIESEKNEINLHLLSGFMLTENDAAGTLKRVMSNIFGWQNAFVRHYSEVVDDNKNAANGDKEEAEAEWQRELFLLRQQELVHQAAGEIRTQTNEGLKLGPLVRKVMGMDGFVPSKMNFITDSQTTITDREKIDSYNLSEPIIRNDAFVCQEALLHLAYFDLRQPDIRRRMNIHLSAEKEDGKSLYFRVTITVIPLSVDKETSFASTNNRPTVNSLLVAYDLTSPKQRTDEFLYMWKEAQEKQKKGEEKSLTDEQRLICECTDRHVAENLYRGKTLYLNGRYYEAVGYLEDAYKDLSPYYELMQKTIKEKFYDLCYYIGFSYAELGLYKQAFYYLDIISGLHRITFTSELVNCLVNADDVRALPYINDLMAQMHMEQDLDSDEDEPQEHLVKFVNFLKRRKAYVLIERRQYTEAKAILNDLLEDPDSSDFAISELAYIQSQESTPSAESSQDITHKT